MPERPTILITVGQGPTALAVGAGRGCLEIITLLSLFSPLSPSLWVGWLVVFGLIDPLRQYYILYLVVSQREGERKEKG